jgi:hypothetical protein
MSFKSTPRRASDAVERAIRAVKQLPIPQEFKDDLQLAEYILLEVFNHTRPNSDTPAHAESLQDFINHMKELASPAEEGAQR